MLSGRSEQKEEVIAIGKPEHINLNGRQSTAASTTLTTVVDPPIVDRSLKAAIEGVAVSVPMVKSEDTFDDHVDTPVSDQLPSSGTMLGHSCSSVRVNGTVRFEIASSLALVKDATVRLGHDVERWT